MQAKPKKWECANENEETVTDTKHAGTPRCPIKEAVKAAMKIEKVLSGETVPPAAVSPQDREEQ